MSWFRTKDGKKVENVSWQERRNVEYWMPDPDHPGEYIAIPFKCEQCHKGYAYYGDEDGLHCIPCWVTKKTA